MMDVYTHDSYTLVRVTELMREVVAHLLTRDIPEDVASELQGWRNPLERHVEGSVQEVEGESIPFQLVRRMHEQLQQNPMDRGHVYLHELMEGSELILPTIKPPERLAVMFVGHLPKIKMLGQHSSTKIYEDPIVSPELVARLQKIRAMQEQQEYDRMVRNIDPMRSKTKMFQLGLEVQSTNRQLWVVMNFLLTVVGAFTFGYFAAYFAGFDVPGCVFLGLFLAILVFMADLYFLVKTPQAVGQQHTTARRAISHRTKKNQ